MSAGFATLRRFVREEAGLLLAADKLYLLEDRLTPLMRDANIASLDELGPMVQRNTRSQLAQSVVEAVTINETSFFRDRALFSSFAEVHLPRLFEARDASRHLRIWCAGCSSGQEPYSLAMIIDEALRSRRGWTIDILGTDLSRSVIQVARAGRYSQFEVQRGLPIRMLMRHFVQDGQMWEVNEALRSKVVFESQNLLRMPCPNVGFDMIFCRNVLYYFDPAIRRNVLSGLATALKPEGLLILGATECGTGGLSTLFEAAGSPFAFRLRTS